MGAVGTRTRRHRRPKKRRRRKASFIAPRAPRAMGKRGGDGVTSRRVAASRRGRLVLPDGEASAGVALMAWALTRVGVSAVLVALEEGDISAKERGMLATFASELGLTPKEMHDIEREARAARGAVA